jgi:hypothetical protein
MDMGRLKRMAAGTRDEIRCSLSQYNCHITSKRAESIINTGRDIAALLELTTHHLTLLQPTSEAFFEMDHKG